MWRIMLFFSPSFEWLYMDIMQGELLKWHLVFMESGFSIFHQLLLSSVIYSHCQVIFPSQKLALLFWYNKLEVGSIFGLKLA